MNASSYQNLVISPSDKAALIAQGAAEWPDDTQKRIDERQRRNMDNAERMPRYYEAQRDRLASGSKTPPQTP